MKLSRFTFLRVICLALAILSGVIAYVYHETRQSRVSLLHNLRHQVDIRLESLQEGYQQTEFREHVVTLVDDSVISEESLKEYLSNDLGQMAYALWLHYKAAIHVILLIEEMKVTPPNREKLLDEAAALESVHDRMQAISIRNRKVVGFYDAGDIKELLRYIRRLSTMEPDDILPSRVGNRALEGIMEQIRALNSQMGHELQEMDEHYRLQIGGYLSGLVLVFLLCMFLIHRTEKKLKHAEEQVTGMIDTLKAFDDDEVTKDSPFERLSNLIRLSLKANSKKNDSIEDSEAELEKVQRLASMLGYEIHDLTTVLAGGIAMTTLEDEAAVSKANQGIMAEVKTALDALEVLSDNFMSIFDRNQTTTEETIDVRAEIDRVMVLLNSKCRTFNKFMDMLVDPAVPEKAVGSNYRFYWTVHNILTKFAEQVGDRSYFVHVTTEDHESLEQQRIIIDMMPSDTGMILQEVLTSDFDGDTPEERLSEQNYFQTLLSTFFGGEVKIYMKAGFGIALRLSIDLVVTQRAKKVETKGAKKLLVCAPQSLEYDVLEQKLAFFNVEMARAHSPGDLMKAVAKATDYDGLLMLDLFEKVHYQALIQNIKGRFEGKFIFGTRNRADFQSLMDDIDFFWDYPIFEANIIELLGVLDEESGAVKKDDLSAKKVLVVDDDPSQSFVLTRLLERMSITANVVNSGQKAIEQYQDDNYDIIFMDCVMPGMTGLEATQKIREIENVKRRSGAQDGHIVIIGNTALSTQAELNECIASGMDNIIQKPYKYERVFNMVSRYV